MAKLKKKGNRSGTRQADVPGRTRAKSAKALPARAPAPRHDFGSMPIVGIGASAGGLEALEQFPAKVPPDCGMAFVVVQHLDPTRKGIMTGSEQRR